MLQCSPKAHTHIPLSARDTIWSTIQYDFDDTSSENPWLQYIDLFASFQTKDSNSTTLPPREIGLNISQADVVGAHDDS